MMPVTGEPIRPEHPDPERSLAAGTMVAQARWAARALAAYDRPAVLQIAEAVARAGEQHARRHAQWAVRETGMGVVEHKVRKNLACSRGLIGIYRDHDYVSQRLDAARAMVELPSPAGVILAATPSTSPVSTVYSIVLLAGLTRNAVVLSPHPGAKGCSCDAAAVLAEAAVSAGAPDGMVQWVEHPSMALADSLMRDERVDLVLAAGSADVVRSASVCGNPALTAGPGNVPVFVDASADVPKAARLLVESKEFDHSLMSSSESVLVVEDTVRDELLTALEHEGAAVLDPAQAQQLTSVVFAGGSLDPRFAGRSAAWIAGQAGLHLGPKTRLLVVPFDHVLPEEPLSHGKLAPVLGLVRVPSVRHGIDAARAVLRTGGAGHSAVIHSRDAQTVLDYSLAVPALRVVVNAAGSTGGSGMDTHLAPAMMAGTGFAGRSALGHNLEPADLVNWCRVAYPHAPGTTVPDFRDVVGARRGTASVRVPIVPPPGTAAHHRGGI